MRGATMLGAALAVLGVQPLAHATPAPAAVHATTTVAASTASDTTPEFAPVCGEPGKGRLTCYAMRATDQPPQLRLGAGQAPAGLSPQDIQSAYALPPNGGTGQTIAIVDAYDDPEAEADLAVYRSQYGLPPCTTANGCFKKVDQRGGTSYPQGDSLWATEIALDLDMVSAAAPGANILLVETDNNGADTLGKGVAEAVALGAKYVSNSYGRSGDLSDDVANFGAFYDHPGVAVVAASGDSKYGVSFPSTLPNVTAVGGTTLTADPGSPRGWSETVWDRSNYGPGSGCALNQPKPDFQKDTGCAGRTVADVSAVSDNVAVYLTYGANGTGWQRYGGTSVATPVIASVYAVAGTPRPGTYPNSYLYATGGAGLNDITSGTNGTCDVAYLCNAVKGYDGPTGLGTPAGLAAFRSGPHGTVSGVVKDAATGKPVAHATVKSGLNVDTTDANGSYTLDLPAGKVTDLTVSGFGYTTPAPATLDVADGQAQSRDFTLSPIPRERVRGTITERSGHGWPLYAQVAVAGSPETPVWTDPVTGAYQLSLPRGADYTLDVTTSLPGYEPAEREVTVGSKAVTADMAVDLDADAATAVGYKLKTADTKETFDSSSAAPQGWSVVSAADTNGWQFDDPLQRGNATGGTGSFAVIESDNGSFGPHQDSQLISPAYDFSAAQSASLTFKTEYTFNPTQQFMTVDASSDGGSTWQNVWSVSQSDTSDQNLTERVSLRKFAGQKSVKLRFHFIANWGYFWAVDNVDVQTRAMVPTPGGLVVGEVRDANTGHGVAGAEVGDTADAGTTAVSVATPEDPAVGDGFYALFAAGAGTHTLRATASGYATSTQKTSVRADRVTHQNIRLNAGRLAVLPGKVDVTTGRGGHTTAVAVVSNTGSAPLTARLTQPDSTGWLKPAVKSITLKPGGLTLLTLSLDSSSPDEDKAGDYTTVLTLTADTPYPAVTVPVTLHVTSRA